MICKVVSTYHHGVDGFNYCDSNVGDGAVDIIIGNSARVIISLTLLQHATSQVGNMAKQLSCVRQAESL